MQNISKSRIKSIAAIMFIACLLMPTIEAQNKEIKTLNSKCFNSNAEKVYVLPQSQHLVSGQTLVYSAIVTNASTNQPSEASKVLYLELTNAANKTIMKWQSAIIKSCAQGSVSLSDTLSAGYYTLRAFTNWMANNDDAFSFSACLLIHPIAEYYPEALSFPLPVYNEAEPISLVLQGNALWVDTENTIGLKVNNPALFSIVMNVVDETDSIITTVQTDENGYGVFTILPTKNHKYRFKAIDNNHKPVNIQLPQPLATGVRLIATETPLTIDVCMEPKGINASDLKCLVSSRGSVIASETIGNTRNKIVMTLNKENLPKGIIAVEVVNGNQEVIAGSLLYNAPKQFQPQISIIPDNKISWSANLNATDNTIIAATVITQIDIINSIFSIPSMVEYLNFQSELSNGISLPKGSWLNAKAILQSTPYTNYLWSRNREHKMTLFRENKTSIISGYISTEDTTQRLSQAVIFLSLRDTAIAFKYAITDDQGRFNFILDKPWHNKRLIIQTDPTGPIKSNIKWCFTVAESNKTSVEVKNIPVSEKLTQSMTKMGDVHLINTIFQTHQSVVDTIKTVTPLPMWQIFNAPPNKVVKPADFEDLDDFEQIASNILPAVKFVRHKNKISFSIFSFAIKDWLRNSTIFFNGIPFNDLNYIASLGSKDIQRIEIYNTPMLYGDLTFNGIMAIYTYSGYFPKSYTDSRLQIKQITFNKNEIQLTSKPISTGADRVPDLRQTIFYKPFEMIKIPQVIQPDVSSIVVPYHLIIEGVTTDGIPFSGDEVINLQSH